MFEEVFAIKSKQKNAICQMLLVFTCFLNNLFLVR
jgi:hypothetical protein